MRSIKIGILALYCLLFSVSASKDIEFGTKWDFSDYANSVVSALAMLASWILMGACALMSVRTRDVSVTLDEATVKALVEVLKEQENDTQEVEQDV